ncbi:hypothetical protein NS226_15365 [Aureimonas ureilytica]|uniref:MAE-28990/MAE-18760-like HEPN domain-containing protein n=1 Tax=Aureimonas ureilytica TaxID=401562 RepID=A0A175R8A3_9HYPH|nr:MAE_28990/MAE_18760 family HEPN-like nuclease [Aureimonas ureilytica]KTQ92667.1 hypothetical protein NS226_15365 [Aureimonas ureilytica]
MTIIDELTADLDWRETELALMKVFLQRRDFSPKQHEVLTRAAWSLLYSHYEGFCKFSLTLYFENIANTQKSCIVLPAKTKTFAMTKEIKRLKNLPAEDFISSLEQFTNGPIACAPEFPDVDTKSNLWPNVLEELLEYADIKCPAVDHNRQLLKSLVTSRNGIAHGEKIFEEITKYQAMENAVYQVLYELAFAIETRLQNKPFKAEDDAQGCLFDFL